MKLTPMEELSEVHCPYCGSTNILIGPKSKKHWCEACKNEWDSEEKFENEAISSAGSEEDEPRVDGISISRGYQDPRDIKPGAFLAKIS